MSMLSLMLIVGLAVCFALLWALEDSVAALQGQVARQQRQIDGLRLQGAELTEALESVAYSADA